MKRSNGKIAGFAYSVSAALPLIFQLIIMLVVTILLKSFGSDNAEGVTGNKYYIWMLLFVNQMAFAFLIYMSCRKGKFGPVEEFGLKKRPDFEYLGLGLAMTAALLFFFTPIVAYIGKGLEGLGYHSASNVPAVDSWGSFFMSVFLLAVLPAVFEEGLFRGVILGGLRRYGATFAILVSTVFFMLMHQSVEQSVYQFALGLALAYVAVKTESVIIPMIMHFFSNFVVLLIEFLSFLLSGSAGAADSVVPWQWVAMAIGAAAIVVIVVYEFLVKKRVRQSEQPPVPTQAEQEAAVPKKVMFAYAAFGLAFNVAMLIYNLVMGFAG